MSADQDVDAVDLMKAEAIEGPLPSRGRDLFRTRPSKTLRCESDPPSLGKGKLFDLRHVAPLTAFRPSSGPISTASAPPRISTQPRAPTAVRRSLEQERACERGEHTLEGENERRLGGRRMRLGEDLNRIGDRARDDAGEQDRGHGGDERSGWSRFEEGRA